MIESTGTWANVVEHGTGTFIRAKTGIIWKVLHVDTDSTVLVDVMGNQSRFPHPNHLGAPVQILTPTAEEKAVRLLGAELGATEIAHRNHDEPDWVAPSVTVTPVGTATTVDYHLNVMHGIFTEGLADDEARRAYHKQAHTLANPMAVNHRHSA